MPGAPGNVVPYTFILAPCGLPATVSPSSYQTGGLDSARWGSPASSADPVVLLAAETSHQLLPSCSGRPRRSEPVGRTNFSAARTRAPSIGGPPRLAPGRSSTGPLVAPGTIETV